MSWGPSHQTTRRRRSWRTAGTALVFLGLLAYGGNTALGLLVLVGLGALGWRTFAFARPRLAAVRWSPPTRRADPMELVRQGTGVYLGLDKSGGWRRARPERAVLVLGPPRSGKTSGVIIPTVLAHQGPAVSTSTKADVMAATAAMRSQLGRVWQFDPTGTAGTPARGVERLRWSPVACAAEWDGALLMARAMIDGAGVGAGTTDSTHWHKRAQALLAPLLHAAAVAGRGMGDVVGWIAHHDLDEPGMLLQEHGGSELAVKPLIGLQKTEARELSSIFSAAADAVDVYSSQAALDAAERPNFYAGRFVRSTDAIYIHAPAEHQQLAAPLVCGLLAEIRRATYELHRQQPAAQPVLFALDEVANIAPSCRRSPRRAAARGSSCSPPCRTSARRASAGAQRPTAS